MATNSVVPIARKIANSAQVVEFRSHKQPKQEQLISTKQSAAKKRKSVVNGSSSSSSSESPAADQAGHTADSSVVTLKQAKFDVFKFGIKGLDKQQKENAQMQMAIKLGAAPPKNKCVNYKELLEQQRVEKARRAENLLEHRQFDAKVSAAHHNLSTKKSNSRSRNKMTNSKRKAKVSKGDVGHIKGHIGSFSNGVLKLKKSDLKRLNAK